MSFLVGTDPGLRQTRTPTTQEFTGSGQSSVTLSSDPGSEDNVIITFDGVTQHRSTYSVSGTTVTFSSAVPTGVAKIEATFTTTHPTKVPADNSVTLAKLADGTQGDVLYYAASGAPTLLGAGTSGHFLKTQGAGANPAWAAAGGGKVLQVVSTVTNSVVSGSTTFPADDTIPQNTEGDEGMTRAITPVSATSTLYIDVRAPIRTNLAGNDQLTVALFVDTTADAIAAVGLKVTNELGHVFHINHSVASASTSARTYKMRFGGNNVSTRTMNAQEGGTTRIFGGVSSSTMTITEVEA